MSAVSQKRTWRRSRTLREQGGYARQNDPDFSELSGLRIDLNRSVMLLRDDVVTDGEAEPGAFPGRLGRKKWIEHLFLHVQRNARPMP